MRVDNTLTESTRSLAEKALTLRPREMGERAGRGLSFLMYKS